MNISGEEVTVVGIEPTTMFLAVVIILGIGFVMAFFYYLIMGGG